MPSGSRCGWSRPRWGLRPHDRPRDPPAARLLPRPPPQAWRVLRLPVQGGSGRVLPLPAPAGPPRRAVCNRRPAAEVPAGRRRVERSEGGNVTQDEFENLLRAWGYAFGPRSAELRQEERSPTGDSPLARIGQTRTIRQVTTMDRGGHARR